MSRYANFNGINRSGQTYKTIALQALHITELEAQIEALKHNPPVKYIHDGGISQQEEEQLRERIEMLKADDEISIALIENLELYIKTLKEELRDSHKQYSKHCETASDRILEYETEIHRLEDVIEKQDETHIELLNEAAANLEQNRQLKSELRAREGDHEKLHKAEELIYDLRERIATYESETPNTTTESERPSPAPDSDCYCAKGHGYCDMCSSIDFAIHQDH